MRTWLVLPLATLHTNRFIMDLHKTLELLAAKGDSRHTSGEALVVLYRNEDTTVFDGHLSGDMIALKRMMLEYAKVNSFFRKILLDTADAVRIHLKNGRS